MLLFSKSLPFASFVSSGLKNSLMSSSHLFLGLPTDQFVSILLSRPGFHLILLLVHLSLGRDAILSGILHFIFLCVSIQQGMFIFFICYSASFVLLLMNSIHSYSFSLLSISSSWSSRKETTLSWSFFELCSEPSSVSLSVTQRVSFSSSFFLHSP